MTTASDVAVIVDLALAEDVGSGDWTTLWTVPEERTATARVIAKAKGVFAGTEAARATLRRVDESLRLDFRVPDSAAVEAGQEVVMVRGSARSILTAERVTLNFLQRLSGVATLTRAFVDAVAGAEARILDTRKTTPGLRRLEKQAVLAGGGTSHRFGLHDMVLIKENHVRIAGGIAAAVRDVALQNHDRLAVVVETTNLTEVEQALHAGVDRILFDNMPPDMLREAVRLVRSFGSGTETEASGGVTLATVRAIAETGVDYISVGALTHSAPALDFSLLVEVGSDD